MSGSPASDRTIGIPGVELGDPVIAASIRRGLDRVEERLRSALTSQDEFVTRASRHLAEAGGKRFRPLLTLLAAHFGDPERNDVVEGAVVVELTHLATLYHDDVMDEATVRRGAPSANTRWDNTVAILTGDFLFAKASQILPDLGPWAVRVQAETFERLVTGQIRETVGPAEGQDPVEHYLDVLREKTGSLIATSGRFGAKFAGCEPDIVRGLTEYGETIGMAFQLSDDLLDIASETGQSGKTPGTDLREGVRTLPMLYALADPDTDPRLAELLSGPPLEDDALHAEALQLLRVSEAMTKARAALTTYAEKARAALDPLPDISARAALADLCDYMVKRTG